MRKFLLSLSMLLLFVSAIYAHNSNQKIYDYDSIEYQEVKVLTSIAGVIGPSSATPVNSNELLLALDRIDINTLSADSRTKYISLYDKLSNGNENFQFNYNISIAPQVFLSYDQSGRKDIIRDRRDFFIPYSQEIPSMAAELEFIYGNNAYMETLFPLTNGAMNTGLPFTSFDWLISFRNKEWQFFGNKYKPSLYTEIPTIGRAAVGNQYLNIIIGRSKHQLGAGYTGNLLLGNNYPYQEILKLSATSNFFTYNISLTHFSNQTGPFSFERNHFGGNHQLRLVHRFDFNIMNKIRIAANFANLYYSSASFDFRFFTPFMIFHNYLNTSNSKVIQNPYDESNNMFSLEMEAVIIPGLTANAQFVLDQFQTTSETNTIPNAFGFLFNLSWTEDFENSSYTIWTEAVYTSSFLYLNEKYDSEISEDNLNYNFDWILGYYSNENQSPNIAYSGYPTGPDSIVIALGAYYNNADSKLKATGKISYSMIGSNGGENGQSYPIFGDNIKENTPSGIVWHIITLEGTADWEFINNLDLIGGASLKYNINYKNTNQRNIFIPQCFLGVKWSIY